MNWYQQCVYDSIQKRSFHITGMKRLRILAKALTFAPKSYDLRSNCGGIAVSGEVTLHHEQLYVQISQPATHADTGILIRTRKGGGGKITQAGAITLRRFRCLMTFRNWLAYAIPFFNREADPCLFQTMPVRIFRHLARCGCHSGHN